MRKLLALIIALLITLGGIFPIRLAHAQSGKRVAIDAINSDAFPALTLRFEAFDEQNHFLSELTTGQLRVLEDGQARPVKELKLEQPGVQLTVALNLGPEMSNHYAGVSRYEALQTALQAWIQAQPADTHDSFSLASNTGLQLIRSSQPGEWSSGLTNYQPNLLAETPNLNALTSAVDLVTEANPDNQQKKVILFITPLMFTVNLDAISNLAERASSQGAIINVWLAASESSESSYPEIYRALQDLAAQTGGEFFLFSGQGDLPNIDTYLDPLRYTYSAVFESQASTTDTHTYQIELDQGGAILASETKSAFLKIEPPNPIFLSPPTEIQRAWNKPQGQNESRLLPQETDLRILIEFPDGHPRDLKASRLYVDGNLVLEITTAPFDVLAWDLTSLTSDGRHLIRVEVEDNLGLIKASIDTPVELLVEPSKGLPLKAVFSNSRLPTFAAILLAGAALALVLIFTGRKATRWFRLKRSPADKDPLTQPVPARIEPPSQPRSKKIQAAQERPVWPVPAKTELASASAWLVPVTQAGAPAAGEQRSISPPSRPSNAIPLSRRETTIGSDARRALYRLEASSVSGLHTRILQTPEGDYRILDTGSVAGTWVNYAPVPSGGLLLKHGDLVQIGRETFRFQLAHPPDESQPHVETFEDPA